MVQDAAERRRRTRVALNGEVQGKIHTVASAPVINLSETGALLEVPCALRPGSLYTLRIPFTPRDELNLKSRVVRSYVHGFHSRESGESVLAYRTAVEFLELTDQARARLQQHIARHGGSFDAEFEPEPGG